jgi:hypothetical protein
VPEQSKRPPKQSRQHFRKYSLGRRSSGSSVSSSCPVWGKLVTVSVAEMLSPAVLVMRASSSRAYMCKSVASERTLYQLKAEVKRRRSEF